VRAAALARASFAALVIATFLAIFYAQELKHRDPLLKKPRGGTISFKPVGALPPSGRIHHFAHFDVRATEADTLRVAVVSERSQRLEFVIVVSVRPYVSRGVSWNGRTAAGALAPPGLYSLRVHFEHHGATIRPRLLLRLLGPRA
jgi:hypothetical protein